MPNTRNGLIDAFSLPGYSVPDAVPAQVTNESQTTAAAYKIPIVVWMFVFLVGGYFGLRMILED